MKNWKKGLLTAAFSAAISIGGMMGAPQPAAAAISASQPAYEVVPVIYLSSDSGVQDIPAYEAQVNTSFQAVQEWYKSQLGGKTFDLAPALLFVSDKTSVELHETFKDSRQIWLKGIEEATMANNMSPCDPTKFYYFVTTMDHIPSGMLGAENIGCQHVLPGTAAIPGHMGRLLGGIVDSNWPEDWADEITEAQGGIAHELGHGFGGSCTQGNYPDGGCEGLAHSQNPSIMFSWWEFGKRGLFLEEEKERILQSPFLRSSDSVASKATLFSSHLQGFIAL